MLPATVLVVWVALATQVAAAVPRWFGVTSPAASLVTSALLLLALCAPLAVRARSTAIARPWRFLGAVGAVAAAAFALTALLGERWPMPGALCALLIAAAAEEFIFRRWLVDALSWAFRSASPRNAETSAILLSALTFATLHLTATSDPWASVANLVRLCAIAVVYSAIVRTVGIGAAIVAHASLNYDLVLLHRNHFPLPAWAVALLCVVAVGVALSPQSLRARIHALITPAPRSRCATPFLDNSLA